MSGETARGIELDEHPPGEVTPRQRHGGRANIRLVA